jgi:hypothetical protein
MAANKDLVLTKSYDVTVSEKIKTADAVACVAGDLAQAVKDPDDVSCEIDISAEGNIRFRFRSYRRRA